MALDTATKRRSMFAMGVLSIVIQPIPDASIDAIDKKHFLGLMAAVETSAIVIPLSGKLSVTLALTCTLAAVPIFTCTLTTTPLLKVSNVSA